MEVVVEVVEEAMIIMKNAMVAISKYHLNIKLSNREDSDNDHEGTMYPPRKHLYDIIKSISFHQSSVCDFSEDPQNIIMILK